MRKTFYRCLTITLGRQDERACRRTKRGRLLWERVPGGARFADLFPDLVGRVLTIDNAGLSIRELRLMLAWQWLSANGYV